MRTKLLKTSWVQLIILCQTLTGMQMGFLGNLVKVFPSLAHRPLHLSGESYAGQYIVRCSSRYSNVNWGQVHSHTSWRLISAWRVRPLKSQRLPSAMARTHRHKYLNSSRLWVSNTDVTISHGVDIDFNSAFRSCNISTNHRIRSGRLQLFQGTVSLIVIFFPFKSFERDLYSTGRTHLCGFDLNFTYPQNGFIPDPPLIPPSQRTMEFSIMDLTSRRMLFHEVSRRANLQSRSLGTRDRVLAKRDWKHDALQESGIINPWVCF
jgi:hypothetical protein